MRSLYPKANAVVSPFGADVEAVDHGSPSLGQDVLRPQRPIGALVSEPQQGINQRVWHEHARVQYYGNGMLGLLYFFSASAAWSSPRASRLSSPSAARRFDRVSC